MKVNNSKEIKKRCFFSITLLVIAFGYAAAGFFVRNQPVLLFLFLPFSAVLLIIAVRNLLRLRYFDYEHSGEVLTVKYYSLFTFGRILPALEIPKHKIISHSIRKKGKTHYLNLLIKTGNGKDKKFRFRLTGLSREQIEKIRSSFKG